MSERRAQDVLDYWFGADPLAPGQLAQRMRLWFGGDEPPEIRELRDETLAERFGPLARAAAAGELDGWAGSPRRLSCCWTSFPATSTAAPQRPSRRTPAPSSLR